MYSVPPPWRPGTKPIHPPSIPFTTIIKNGYRDWKKYNARSSRREFWLWTLHVVLIIYPTILIVEGPSAFSSASETSSGGSGTTGTVLGFLFMFPIVPSIAMWVRRIHDTGHRIWRCFIPLVGIFINIALLCSPTNLEENRWSRTTSS
jgi:uncharacterized membrane protein YhaH (DUF805 family)